MDSYPVLLYDGRCGFCSWSVQFVLQHDRKGTLRFAPLEGRFAADLASRHPELRGVDSMVWVNPSADGDRETISVRSDAALQVARYLGGWWVASRPLGWLPRFIRDGTYALVARHRHRLVAEQCLLVDEALRTRFLE